MQRKIKQSHREPNTWCIRGKTLHGKKPRALSSMPTDNQALNQMKVASKNSHPFPNWWLNLRIVLTCWPLTVHFRHAWPDYLECVFKMIQPQMRRETPMLRTSDQQSRSFGEESDHSFNDATAWNQRVVKKMPQTGICAQYICLGHPRMEWHKRGEKIRQIWIFLSPAARAHTCPLERTQLLFQTSQI